MAAGRRQQAAGRRARKQRASSKELPACSWKRPAGLLAARAAGWGSRLQLAASLYPVLVLLLVPPVLPQNEELELQYKTCYARILDSKRRFLEAATRYHELSQVGKRRIGDSEVRWGERRRGGVERAQEGAGWWSIAALA
jgi:hypothetical protein